MSGPYFFDTPPDVRIARLAAEQEGVVSTRQLYDAGLDKAAIQVRVRRGHLHRIHHGVYAVGHTAISLKGRFMAAVLACHGSALSRYSAGALDGYLTSRRSRSSAPLREAAPVFASTAHGPSTSATSGATLRSPARPSPGRCSTSPTTCPTRRCAAPCARPRR
jgi:hypothetical protein